MTTLDKLLTKPAQKSGPEHKLIMALREALAEYDRATRPPDGRATNGRGNPKNGFFRQAVNRAVAEVQGGESIRRAAAHHGISYGAVYNALKKLP